MITGNENDSDPDEELDEKKSFGDLNEDTMFNQGMDTIEDFDEAAQIVEAVQFHYSQHESHSRIASNPKIGELKFKNWICFSSVKLFF